MYTKHFYLPILTSLCGGKGGVVAPRVHESGEGSKSVKQGIGCGWTLPEAVRCYYVTGL